MDYKPLKFSLVCITGVLLLSTNSTKAMATEHAVAGFPYDKAGYELSASTEYPDISTMSSDYTPIPGFYNIGIADVTTNLLVREKPSENGKILGKMPKDAGCEILEPNQDGWTKIKSGKVTGYVKSDYLIIGQKASELALEKANHIAVFNGNGNLRVRKEPSIPKDDESKNVIDSIAPGEEILVLDPLVVTYGEEINKWVKVSLDGDDSETGTVGYVAKEFVDLSYKLAHAHTMQELALGPGVSSTRANIVNYGKKFLGYRYVWGGSGLNRLKNNGGVDCSGFTQAVYAAYGYSLPRTSREQARRGTSIKSSQLKAGDLVFYGSKSYINHVAIYIGNGKIVHASNKRDGIKISNVYYRTPVKCVRIIND
ncbi:MAG: C40 family peptidase [Clostridiales bacterium]|nr:C40 family peptidase [Clostridiales bacterium]